MSDKVRRTIRAQVRQAGEASEGLVAGYASIFDSFENDRGECFAPGCFAESIRTQHTEPVARGERSRFAVCWTHDWDQPVAVAQVVEEDARGLRFIDQMQLIGPGGLNADRWAQVKAGLVDGVSIEFDSVRSEFENLSEADARALGFSGPYEARYPPRRWTKVFLYGWSYVLHPAQNQARIVEVRAAGGTMDKEKLMEMVAAAVKSQMEALEARLAKLEAVEVEVKPEEEPPAEVAAMAARVVALEKRAADAEYAVWRAQTPAAAKLPDASARALYAAEPKAREGLLKAMGAVPPAMPAMGSGAAASEVEPLSSDPREAYRQISARFPDPKMRDAEWARVRDTYNR